MLEGKPIDLEGMTSLKGELFDATLQFNADKRYVEFIFYVDGFADGKGKAYQGYITFNRETSKTEFSFTNPNKLKEKS